MNSEKEQDRLIALKIAEKRSSFCLEDVVFVLLQYFCLEKFIPINSNYLKSDELAKKKFGFMHVNSIFTAFIGLVGLKDSINFCIKMIKRGKQTRKIKTQIYFIITFIQILLQTTVPIMRAVIVIWSYKMVKLSEKNELEFFMKMNTMVGF